MIRQFLFVIQERVIDRNSRNFPDFLKRKDEGIPPLILYMFPKPIIFADSDHLLKLFDDYRLYPPWTFRDKHCGCGEDSRKRQFMGKCDVSRLPYGLVFFLVFP